MIGITINNRYEIKSELGRGGMGMVYRGVDTQSGKAVAIKLLKSEFVTSNLDGVVRFEREADALRTLNHPNIVKILATGEEGGNHYIVMEYVPRGSLHDLIENDGQLSITTTLEIALDIADALTRVHRLNIIHRDLKPSNVLLADDGTVRLADFGLARLKGKNITQVGLVIGTLVYMSPEVIQGMQADARSDIWAFGAVLFEMLAGRLPFNADNPLAIALAITTQPPLNIEVLRPDAPIALVDLIYRMLDKDPRTRIPSVRLVGAELEAILAGSKSSSEDLPRIAHPVASRFDTPSPHPLSVSRHNIPMQTTPFIGRTMESADLSELFANPATRLLTILGPGGIGKTRLALEAARAQLPNFENGVYFVSLAPLGSAENITPAIADAVGFQFFEGLDPKEQLIGYFRTKQFLLVLDNFEHILDGADLVSDILQSAPGVKVLATSREKLNLQEEIRFRIDGLDFPEDVQPKSVEAASQFSAIRLFVQSAKRACPSFELEISDLKPITRICRLVNGIPLGIILAAAWVEMFSPQEITEEVSRNLDFLETGVSDISERHRSMRAVFESTWRQLKSAEQETFMKLAVFRGGFRRGAAQAVAGANLQNLISFVSKSMLHRDPSSGRYEVHELLRQYAEEHLEASGQIVFVHNSHCAYYTTFLEERLGEMLGPRQVKALDEIAADFRNVRQAWLWAVEKKDFAVIDRATESLFVFSDMRSREFEGVDLLGLALERLTPNCGDEPHPAWSRLLLPWYDLMVQSKGRPKNTDEIKTQNEINLALARKRDDLLGIAHGLLLKGHFCKPARALEMYEQVLDLVPRLEDSFWVRIRIGFCYHSMGEYQKAIQAFWQSHARGSEIGENEKMGWSLFNIGETEIYLGDLANAETHMRASNNYFRQVGTLLGVIGTNINLSLMLLLNGNFQEARSLVEEAQEIARDTNRPSAYRNKTLLIFGYQALVEDDYQKAEFFFDEILSTSNTSPDGSLGMAYAACGLDDYSTAIQHIRKAIQPTSPYQIPVMGILCVPATALILAHEGETERAMELLALAFHHPTSPSKLLGKWPQITKLFAALEAKLPPEIHAAAVDRGQSLDIDEIMVILADQFGVLDGAIEKTFKSHLGAIPSLIEPLSEREMEVLQLLKTELSGPEMAHELMISLNTIRFHTKNIYTKLGVNNRRSAVNRGFKLGL